MNGGVRPKKRLGQHFLKDETIAAKIAASLTYTDLPVIEIGPGMGALTKHLINNIGSNLWLVEIDEESIQYLNANYPVLKDKIIHADFLRLDLEKQFNGEPFSIIGNFPYNISTQILFKALDYKKQVKEVVGMFQKEVAKRICSPPGNKDYGILSVLIQAYFDTKYLFDVPPSAFFPPPEVNSGVIKLVRKTNTALNCNEELFTRVVKTGFNQRRKKLSNALSSIIEKRPIKSKYFDLRAEQLAWQDFVELTNTLA